MNSSLHTKYRPKILDDVVGQEDSIKSLRKVLQDRRSHTFLFTGPAGCGKTTLARILAAEFADNKGTIANVEEVDAATNSGVDSVRSIANRALFRAVGSSPIKAIIVDECHRFSAAAWAALLKPIEEPPKHVYWMFCSTDPGRIPKPIQTRCLKYDLKPVNETLLLKLLKRVTKAEGLDVSVDVLEAIAEASGGSPRQALVYLEACLYCENGTEARKVMRSAGQSREAIDLCRFLTSGRGGWPEAIKIIKGLEGQEPESIRIVVVNYLSTALMNTNTEGKAKPLLFLLECFMEPYNQSDRAAPLLRSVGLSLGMDQ